MLKTSAGSYWFPNLSVSPLPLDRQLPDRGEQRLASLSDRQPRIHILSALWSKKKQSVRAICWEGGSVTFMTVSHSYLIQSVSRENVTNSPLPVSLCAVVCPLILFKVLFASHFVLPLLRQSS